MSAMGERAEARVETSPPVRLAKGEIPTTWSRPAEQVSQLPIRAPRPLTSGIIVVSGAVVGFCLAVWLAPTRRAPAQPPEPKPAVVVAVPVAPPPVAPPPVAPPPVAPPPVAAIPVPPPTSSTSPGDVAPEDQGGADRAAPPASSVAVEDAAETPARAKARKETDRAKALFQSGELIGAESPLIRATLGDPSYAEGWRMLGAVRDALGNVDGARRAYKKFLQLEPTAPQAKEVRAALAALAAAPKPADAAAPTPPSP